MKNSMRPSARAVRRGISVLVLAAFAAAPCVAAPREQRQESTRSFDRTVSVMPAQALRVEHRHGDVRITTHARSDLRVQAVIRVSADSERDAAQFLERVQIEMLDTPTAVTVRTIYPEHEWSRRNISYAVDYTLLMPEKMPLDVHNSFGSVAVSGAKAGISVVNAHGTLTVADITGRSRLENSFAATEASRMNGDVTITGSNGDVSATTIAGALEVTCRFGRVAVGAVRGAALVGNSNGQVEVADAASATITNSFGAVTVRDVGTANISNSNGAVRVTGVRGPATVKTSFAPVTMATIAGAVDVTNSNGDVTLKDVSAAADIRSSFGRIEVQGVKTGVRVTTGNSSVRVIDVQGPVTVKTSFGLIAVERVRGAFTADNSNGGVEAADVRGAAQVNTSFGPVTLRDVEGAVNVRNQNGAVEVTPLAQAGRCHNITVETSFSPIRVHLPQAGYNVAARTSFGRIRTDVPITVTGSTGEGTLSGTIGAGGCSLQLTNANGDIQIAGGAAQ
jgi:hypothetical protein